MKRSVPVTMWKSTHHPPTEYMLNVLMGCWKCREGMNEKSKKTKMHSSLELGIARMWNEID
jgi:hypothetical protein